jgi:hypothetical protein
MANEMKQQEKDKAVHSESGLDVRRMRGGALKTAGCSLALWIVLHVSAVQAGFVTIGNPNNMANTDGQEESPCLKLK